MNYARTENNIVVQVLRVDPLTIFAPHHATLFQPCAENVEVGWLWDGQTFVAPVVPPIDEAERIANLWQAAHDYEYAQVSGSAIGLLAMGVIQGLPKCLAVQNWIKSIWTLYYERKAGTSEDYDFSVAGQCPHTVPELMIELGV